MSNETIIDVFQLLEAYIKATGYEIHNVNGEYGVVKKKPKPRAPAKETGYSSDFIELWDKYPKGHSGSKAATYRQFAARLKKANGDSVIEYRYMTFGIDRYIKYIEATGYSVKSSETFFGRDRHYTNPFEVTDNLKKQSRLKVPFNDDDLVKFASDNGLKKCGNTDTYDQFRRQLRAEIEQRELSN